MTSQTIVWLHHSLRQETLCYLDSNYFYLIILFILHIYFLHSIPSFHSSSSLPHLLSITLIPCPSLLLRKSKTSHESQQSMTYQGRTKLLPPASRMSKSPCCREYVPKSQIMHQGQILVPLLGAPQNITVTHMQRA